MNDTGNIQKSQLIGRLYDLTSGKATPDENPFLYFLPHILEYSELKKVDFPGIDRFVRMALSPDPVPLVKDALTVLNRLVDGDGNLVTPQAHMFGDLKYFRWVELGSRTDSVSVIVHIINRAISFTGLGKS